MNLFPGYYPPDPDSSNSRGENWSKTASLLSCLILAFLLSPMLSPLFSQDFLQLKTDDVWSQELEIADFLYQKGNYQEALLRYQLLLLKTGHDSLQNLLRYRLVLTNLRLKRIDKAQEYLGVIRGSSSDSSAVMNAHLLDLMIDYYRGIYLKALERSLRREEDPFFLIALYSLLALGWYQEADSLLLLRMETFPVPIQNRLQELSSLLNTEYPQSGWRKKILFFANALLPGSAYFFMGKPYQGLLTSATYLSLLYLSFSSSPLSGNNQYLENNYQQENQPREWNLQQTGGFQRQYGMIYPENRTFSHSGLLTTEYFTIAFYLASFYSLSADLKNEVDIKKRNSVERFVGEYPLYIMVPIDDPFQDIAEIFKTIRQK